MSARVCVTRTAARSRLRSRRRKPRKRPSRTACSSLFSPFGALSRSWMSSTRPRSLTPRRARRARTPSRGATYAARTTTVSARAPTAIATAVPTPAWSRSTCSMTPLTCSPIVRKTAPSSSSSTVRQFCESESRCCGDRSRAARMPVTMPATTAPTSPEAPSSVAGTAAAKGTANEMTVLTVASRTWRRTARFSQPTSQPITTATATE